MLVPSTTGSSTTRPGWFPGAPRPSSESVSWWTHTSQARKRATIVEEERRASDVSVTNEATGNKPPRWVSDRGGGAPWCATSTVPGALQPRKCVDTRLSAWTQGSAWSGLAHERHLLDEQIEVVCDIARVDRMPRRECDDATRRVERRAGADLPPRRSRTRAAYSSEGVRQRVEDIDVRDQVEIGRRSGHRPAQSRSPASETKATNRPSAESAGWRLGPVALPPLRFG